MANLPALADGDPPASKGPSLVVQLAVFVVLSAVAGGTGWFLGQMLKGEVVPAAEAPAAPAAAAGHEAPAGQEGHGKEGAPAPNLLRLEPVTTNLATPSNTWVRMELSLVFDGPADTAIGEAVHQDILAYMRTVRLPQVEGGSGFRHLKSDIEERARIRSDGKVKSVLVNTMIFE